MRVITRQTLANSVAARWEAQYNGDVPMHKDTKKVGNVLRGLGDHPDPNVVNSIIGNNSWTSVPECSECKANNCEFVIMVGYNDDYTYLKSYLCFNCASDAYAMGVDVARKAK